MKIPLIVDLPVGQNLIEHPLLNLIFRTNYTEPNATLENLVERYLNGLGPLTKGGSADGTGFIHTKNNSQVPSIQIAFAPPNDIDPSISRRSLNYNNTISETFLKNIKPESEILIYVMLLHEKSRGRILLNSNNPIDFPKIDLNMFEEQEDVDTLVEGVEYTLSLLETDAFKKINATLLQVPICTNFRRTKQQLKCVIRNMAATVFHPCGTAAMGPDPRKFVVDDALRVHGFKNLRVVDASIFPWSVSGNLNAPTVMVAEKAADIIKTKLGY
ncbi:alcohol dehydrogenase [acceptor]-like [Zophobas morio]|uniref:alcohol dehydrogenase [acceptor]-like n=1 Tax=Zophobas morio TaxID=2755281 RepID=UPI003083C09E